ncbi:MAG: uracil-DNA glycosylase [Burkholderiales bacterium]|uniref:uracil-DNA glycosylase n=1 Tax=Nitrosomonas sp. TaxID=42353 RepID=UPI001D877AAC|nr:uracil-DNA glycosylase [Nitrosomonas sp.]MCB1949977.1 uracil-DNA glycosylase [Nitrosomonas sp.]MCP5244096.1 uracil-DNA glycosylase [Burkholderiales bacterium]
MNTRRKVILRELGLTPLWRLRKTTATVDSSLETTDAEVTQTDALKQPGEQNPEIGQMDWAQLASTVASCTACPLRQTCTQTVFGVGDQNADWLYIGEGPGAREDALGEPFVGQAGKLLDNMLAAIQLKRGQNVYITNIVKCRPPNNRNPSEDEAKQCAPYLARQIELIKPKLIVALGKVAAQNLLNSNDSIANLRGKIHDFKGIPLIVTYHPAYLLRALPEKAKAWKDLCMARAFMESQS